MLRVGKQVKEALLANNVVPRSEAGQRVTALLEEAEKQAKADTTKTKKAQPAKSTNGVIEWDNLDLRTVRITPASSRLGDYILSPDNKKLFYFSATELGKTSGSTTCARARRSCRRR